MMRVRVGASGKKPVMHTVCVFCGSSPGARPAYTDAARRFGAALARRCLGLVYGGGHVGLMGAVADLRPQRRRRLSADTGVQAGVAGAPGGGRRRTEAGAQKR